MMAFPRTRNFLQKNLVDLRFLNPTVDLLVREYVDVNPIIEIGLHPVEHQQTVKNVDEILKELDLSKPSLLFLIYFFLSKKKKTTTTTTQHDVEGLLTGKSLRAQLSGGPGLGILFPVADKTAEEIENQVGVNLFIR